MAHLIFIAKNRDLSSFLLTGPAVLGRSVECDVYTPDVFVSRQHCRFEKTEDGWVVVDQRSRNGIFYNGRRVYRRVLKHGDLIEIGSFTVRFHQGDIPAALSTMTPFGEGTSVVSLMDTLFSGGLRPAEYMRKSMPKPAWVRAREEAEAAALRQQQEIEEAARVARERLNFSDGCELDIELQIAESAESLTTDYVLISRATFARFKDLLSDETVAGMDRAGESIQSARVAPPAGPEETKAGTLMAARAEGKPASLQIGPRGPSGAVKNLWEEVYAEVEKPASGKGSKKDKRAAKEEAQAAKEDAKAAKLAAKEAKKDKPKEKKEKKARDVEYRPPIGERVKEWYAWAKTVDVSVGGLLTAMRANPRPFVIAATFCVVLGGGWGLTAVFKPKYHVNTKNLTAEQAKYVQDHLNDP